MLDEEYDAIFGDYSGRMRWSVSHPDYERDIIVKAPDDIAAIKTAGDYWRTDWLSHEFYAYCHVLKV